MDSVSYVGRKYGDLEVIGTVKRPYQVTARCKCGRESIYSIPALEEFSRRACSRCEPTPTDSLIGKKMWKLTVIESVRKATENLLLCRCECGNTRKVRPSVFLKGEAFTCGKCNTGVITEEEDYLRYTDGRGNSFIFDIADRGSS